MRVMMCMSKKVWEILGKRDRKSTRLNSSHANISYAVFCLKKKKAVHTDGNTGASITTDSPIPSAIGRCKWLGRFHATELLDGTCGCIVAVLQRVTAAGRTV